MFPSSELLSPGRSGRTTGRTLKPLVRLSSDVPLWPLWLSKQFATWAGRVRSGNHLRCVSGDTPVGFSGVLFLTVDHGDHEPNIFAAPVIQPTGWWNHLDLRTYQHINTQSHTYIIEYYRIIYTSSMKEKQSTFPLMSASD